MRLVKPIFLCACAVVLMTACGRMDKGAQMKTENTQINQFTESAFDADTKITDVIRDPAFGDYGRLLFPVDFEIPDNLKLKDVREILPWYSKINTDKTVELVNTMKERAQSGEQIFYDIYSDAEKKADPEKKDTGLFFFRGDAGAKTAIVNAGGGFVYVAGIHDSFPQALELSKKDTMPLHLFTGRGHRLPVKISPGQSLFCRNMPASYRLIWQTIPSGADLPVHGWLRGWALMELLILARPIIRLRRLLSCNIQVCLR